MTDRDFVIKGGIMGRTTITHHVEANTYTITVMGITKEEKARYTHDEFMWMANEIMKYVESQNVKQQQ
jgi:hypothetical protein